ncbi:MAG: hypothetical protein HeimC2_14080 [Candidatus Heimdallarchaeota archaeon LC_2]|nr:MAG: hypothetical protein HeimC2_14080 [Candidatus Heimdallarchaeota archaeon LC_2]
MPSELQFEIFSVYPNDAMKPNVLTEYKFKFGSIAGCVGNEINRKKKPGINEDGGMVIVTETKILSLMIDGHYSRDTTDILLNVFKQNIEENTQLIINIICKRPILFHNFKKSLSIFDCCFDFPWISYNKG